MWLLQLDLANHSQWTRELNSFPDAFRLRREFALRVKEGLNRFGFDRLSWGGDGGVFVADGARAVTEALNAAVKVRGVFDNWRGKARQGERLALRVSLHRTRVTTADDPAYCFGTELNEFMKYERKLRDPDDVNSTVVTGRVLEDMTHEQQQHWRQLSASVGTLGRPFCLVPDPVAESRVTDALEWMEGAWFSGESNSWAYVGPRDAGRRRFVYCYGGDNKYVGEYENLEWDGRDVIGTFAWVAAPISGRVRLTPSARHDRMKGGWWYAEDLPSSGPPTYGSGGMIPSSWTKKKGKAYPKWALRALAGRAANLSSIPA
jgi:hypothetical protein